MLHDTIAVDCKPYRGAYIHIRSKGHRFEYFIFYRGKFYSYYFDIATPGNREYSESEFLRSLDATLIAAKATIDKIKRSEFFPRIIETIQSYAKQNIRKESVKLSDNGQGREEAHGSASDKVSEASTSEG